MEKAKKIISTNTMTLTDLAFYLGYSDLAAFSNQFKKHWGTSPSLFSKN
jgi:AraC family transcriptional regulator